MMASAAISRDDAIDAEFETLAPASMRVNVPQFAPSTSGGAGYAKESAQLDLLRTPLNQQYSAEHPERLTPSFLFFTFLAALAVFWVSGGRALLY